MKNFKNEKINYLSSIAELNERAIKTNDATIKRLQEQNEQMKIEILHCEDELKNRFGLEYCVNCNEWIDEDKFNSLSEEHLCDHCVRSNE